MGSSYPEVLLRRQWTLCPREALPLARKSRCCPWRATGPGSGSFHRPGQEPLRECWESAIQQGTGAYPAQGGAGKEGLEELSPPGHTDGPQQVGDGRRLGSCRARAQVGVCGNSRNSVRRVTWVAPPARDCTELCWSSGVPLPLQPSVPYVTATLSSIVTYAHCPSSDPIRVLLMVK